MLCNPWAGSLSGLSDTFFIQKTLQANTGTPPWPGTVRLVALSTEWLANDFGDASLGQVKIK